MYLPTGISRCATAATCDGTANEIVQTISYDIDNLLPTIVTTASGNGAVTSTVTTTYDAFDRVLTVDGPLSGSDDTTRYYYDSAGRVRGLIGPDPDGGGSLLRRAVRYTYDAEDRVTLVERGTATSQSSTAIASITVLESIATAYDANGRRTSSSLVASSTTHALTQYSYNARGLLECTAVRMNPAEFGSRLTLWSGRAILLGQVRRGPHRFAGSPSSCDQPEQRPQDAETAGGGRHE